MDRKKEVVRAVLSLILLAVIVTIIMVIIWQLVQWFDAIGIEFGYFGWNIMSTANGVLIGIGAGFSFVIAKRLFNITIFDK
jgi:hypothetical protein